MWFQGLPVHVCMHMCLCVCTVATGSLHICGFLCGFVCAPGDVSGVDLLSNSGLKLEGIEGFRIKQINQSINRSIN